MAMATARIQAMCTLLLFFMVPAAAARPPPPAWVAAAPPLPAAWRACAGAGVQPLKKPLAFCGGKIGEPTCCDAGNDSSINLEFVFSRPSTPTHDADADAYACAASIRKWRLCNLLLPSWHVSQQTPHLLRRAPSTSGQRLRLLIIIRRLEWWVKSMLGAMGAVLLAWFVWKKMLQEEQSCSCSTGSCSVSCSCRCCNNITVWCY